MSPAKKKSEAVGRDQVRPERGWTEVAQGLHTNDVGNVACVYFLNVAGQEKDNPLVSPGEEDSVKENQTFVRANPKPC
jgi:hypothetical protein